MDETTVPLLPELAGVCTYARAARVGLPVAESVRRLLRYQWTLRRLSEILVSRLPGTPEWEVKGAFALHQWLDAEHAQAVMGRVAEMRHPVPRMDVPPHPTLELALREAAAAPDTLELLAGVYGVLRPALVGAWRSHLELVNPLADHPTRRILRLALVEQEEMASWGSRVLELLAGASGAHGARRRQAWETRVRERLDAAGGVEGAAPGAPADGSDADGAGSPAPGEPAGADEPLPEPVVPDLTPRRDARFRGAYNFNFPPHVVYAAPHVPADERNLALLCKRLLEMDVPEMMASFMTERRDQPWELRRDYARQLWDEARHSMMGEAALEARGVAWRTIPLNVGFALRLALHADPFDRQLVLWAIEQGLMPKETGKRYEYETAVEAGDALSAHFHDYDWADEVLHVQIGRKWLRHEGLEPAEAVRRGRVVHERTWKALEAYREREPQEEWWSDFVREVLGRETAARPEELVEDPTVIAE